MLSLSQGNTADPIPDNPRQSGEPALTVKGTTISPDTAARHARKYASRNPIQRWILSRFFGTVRGWLDRLAPVRVLDFGCGEGFFWRELGRSGPLPEVVGLDLREEAVAVARGQCPGLTFYACDLFAYTPPGRFDLAVCSEVLEHLHDPARYLAALCRLADRILLTVPHEPYFRLCNLLRGRDLGRLGNHPEHVQHWSPRGFAEFVSEYIAIDALTTSFPFILVHGRPRMAWK